MSNGKPKIIAVVGPTASGKTTLAIKIAKKFNGEIISADSRQIYRGMDIGTAKTRLIARGKALSANGIRHRLIDIKNPNEPYTVAEYQRDALRAIRAILKKKKLPVLVGGTGLYVQAVLENFSIPAVKPDKKLRRKLEAKLKKEGKEALFKELLALDPEAAYVVDPQNPRRLVRALEVALTTKRPFSAQRNKGTKLFNALRIGLNPPRDALKRKIRARVDEMVENGFLEEVRGLVRRYGPAHQAFDAIGYREIIDYLDGKLSLEEALELVKRKTLNYAKRQMTWFRRDREIHWIKNQEEARKLILQFLK